MRTGQAMSTFDSIRFFSLYVVLFAAEVFYSGPIRRLENGYKKDW